MESVKVAFGYCDSCYHPAVRLQLGDGDPTTWTWDFHHEHCEGGEPVPCDGDLENEMIGAILGSFIKPENN